MFEVLPWNSRKSAELESPLYLDLTLQWILFREKQLCSRGEVRDNEEKGKILIRTGVIAQTLISAVRRQR